MKINVITGDITQVRSDALITAINSGGMWFGGIDGAIMGVAGNLFHQQAKASLPLSHGDTVLALSNGVKHRGEFSNVVFVIDDLTGALSDIIRNGLEAASNAKFKSVTLPTIRMGVMLGVVEKTREQAVDEMVKGVKRFLKWFPNTTIECITFVVYVDPDTLDLLKHKLAQVNK